MNQEYYFLALIISAFVLMLVRHSIEIKYLKDENQKALDILNRIHKDFFKGYLAPESKPFYPDLDSIDDIEKEIFS